MYLVISLHIKIEVEIKPPFLLQHRNIKARGEKIVHILTIELNIMEWG